VTLLGRPLEVANVGVELFADELESEGVRVERVDWRPPAPAVEEALARLAKHAVAIAACNDRAVARLQDARPVVVGVGLARDCLPELGERTILHAGPPLSWEEMAGPLRGAIVGAALYEGFATSEDDAFRMAQAGAFEFVPCHERSAVGPMAGIVSPSMPVWIVENETHGNRAYATLNEGLGRVLRYGAYDAEVLDRLRWLEHVLAPVLDEAVRRLDAPLDLTALIAQALEMGDDGHNRNRAGTSLLLRALLPSLFEIDRPAAEIGQAVRFVAANDHFFLNLTMSGAKTSADAAAGVRGSSIVTAMTRNGTRFGLRVSGTGDRWFTGPAGKIGGVYLPGFGPDDAALDLGDSAITETVGLGAFAMAAAPAIAAYVGGTAADCVGTTHAMEEITWAKSRVYRIPALDFAGTPVGIDCRAVAATGVLPTINTGIAHREPGVGQIGAGVVRAPMEAFVDAVRGLADAVDG
jgi:hypothetical protein